MRETISIREAVTRLLETGTIKKSLKKPYEKVRKLLEQGVIHGIPFTKKLTPWQVYKDSLENYILLKNCHNTVSIKEAASRLLEALRLNKSHSATCFYIRKLLIQGVIKGIPPTCNTAPWQVYKDSLEEYIEVETMKAVEHSKKLVPPTQCWLLKKEITSIDIDNILLKINHIRKLNGFEYINSEGIRKLSNYINQNLVSPLDALFVTDEMAKYIGRLCIKTPISHNGQLIRIVGLCLALKFQIKLDYSIAIRILKNTFGRRQSLQASNESNIKSCYELMYWVTKILYHYVTDGPDFLNDLDNVVIVEKNISAVRKGSDVFLYLFAILLDNGKNAWKDVSIITIGQLRKYYLTTPIMLKRQKAQMDYLYGTKTNLSSIFFTVKFKENQKYIEDESNKKHILYSPEKFDEIREMVENYRIYLRMKKISTSKFNRFASVFNKKPKFITEIKQLTVENIQESCQKYINHCKVNRIDKRSCRTTIRTFLSVLVEMKQVFGQRKSLIGITYDFPFDEKLLLDNNTGVPEQLTIYGRIKKSEFTKFPDLNSLTVLSSTTDDNELSEGLTERSGTLKTDILLADKIVRAIYQYNPKASKGSHEYFHEYQYTTMLRIMGDAGTRSDEVINMPYNTLSYLNEHDVNIVILGLSKLGDRFGVVPVGKETAKMIEECSKLRMTLFPDSEILMKMTGDKGYIEEKYIRQFISVDKRNGAIRGVNIKSLVKHLDKICNEAGITRPPKTRFHFLRHRAAEYFFLGMSEYEFEHGDDANYKMEVIKRLLRHQDINMTNKYAWSSLLDMLAEKNIVFLRDLKSVKDYNTKNNIEAFEQKTLIESLEKRIQKDLETEISKPGIHRIKLLLASPLTMLPNEAFRVINYTQDVSKIIKFIRQVDGEKSEGTIAISGAAFGRCVNPTCWRHNEKITCISCNDHLIQKSDEPRLLREIVNCHLRTQEIYQNYNDTFHKEQLRSLQSRISICIDKLNTWLGLNELEIIQKVQKHLRETVIESEINLKAFINELENMNVLNQI
ncbi:tyrosine-type recombinase/integrase [Bacillus sp. AFS088145]|uniref:tyrosine-type recombinase/integrase n=1 Tax=Bacillus sp. AFS088145 TaxID=2033514 RepID=UPI000BF320F7|nr:tyrosine-type recombinase/integrase [Bacillus sp. AFS088145]PFH92656.1 hypothetical protein COI44_00250 [Bacillus sp. AFS088145]